MTNEPYHKELHEIMLRKGYTHKRDLDEETGIGYDLYEKGGRSMYFDEHEYMIMTEPNGEESPIDIFIRETDNIFDPGD